RSISDFIQKKCPPMRAREKAGLVLARIGKSAADMAKELGFYQILWDCRAVKRDKRPAPPCPRSMQGTGNDFLSRSGLSDDHDVARDASGDPDFADQWIQRRIAREKDASNIIPSNGGGSLHPDGTQFSFELVTFHRGKHLALEFSLLERLTDVSIGAESERLYRRFELAMRGDHENR